jgi:DNA mismatch endonuclease (patch repair protein)
MADVVDKTTRSRMMSGIRGKDTGPERDLRRELHRLGLRYRLHSKKLPGTPDIVLPKFRAVLFVHGCFWHSHRRCRFATKPASNADFWKRKLAGNVRRDKRHTKALLQDGWRAAIVWECAVRSRGANMVADKVVSWLRSNRTFVEIPKTQKTKRKRSDFVTR